MRCEICSSLSATNFGHPLDCISHHSSFQEVEKAAAAGCELCQIFVWSCRLHQPQIGTYDVQLKEARAATGPVYLRRMESQVAFEIGRTSSDESKKYSTAIPFSVGPVDEIPSEVPETYDGLAVQDRLLQWLESCDMKHKACRDLKEGIANRPRPARLLQLGSPDLHRLRLIPAVGQQLKYAALSYIWGTEPHGAMTLSSNLEGRMNDISFPSLPRVYREAIQLCRTLDIWYLWIDAFCIVQPEAGGQDQDWQEQSAIMGSIYAGAYVTIAAAATTSANDSLFGAGRVLRTPPPPCRLFASEVGKGDADENLWMIPKSSLWTILITYSQLQSRGWVFQERLMSRRIIHLTTYEACWECHEAIASEHLPNGIPSEMNNNTLMFNEYGCWRQIPKPNFGSRDLAASEKANLLKILWPSLAGRYTARSLSMHTDIFPAISAVAKVLHDATGSDYVAGFWNPVSVADLIWVGGVVGAVSKSAETRHRQGYDQGDKLDTTQIRLSANPSWSWSSVTGAVWLHTLQNPAPEIERAAILEIYARPLYEANPFGQLQPGASKLRIKGPMRKGAIRADVFYQRRPSANVDPHQYLFGFSPEIMDGVKKNPGEFKGRGWACVLLLLQRNEEKGSKRETAYHRFTAMAVVEEYESEGSSMEGDRYKRVGLAKTWDENMFDKEFVEEMVLEIV